MLLGYILQKILGKKSHSSSLEEHVRYYASLVFEAYAPIVSM